MDRILVEQRDHASSERLDRFQHPLLFHRRHERRKHERIHAERLVKADCFDHLFRRADHLATDPERRATIAEIVEVLLQRYREGMAAGPRLLLGLAHLFGVVDRDRLVSALQTGLREVASDPTHPLRARIAEAIAELPERLRTDRALAAHIEALKAEALESPAVARLAEDAAAAVRQAIAADLKSPASEVVGWIADRLERARQRVGQRIVEFAAFRHTAIPEGRPETAKDNSTVPRRFASNLGS